ncbi:hypothetical protein CDEF62S_05283 [Castellaniella defragrans]
MKTFQHLSAEIRLTDELERQLMQEAMLAQEEWDIVGGLRRAGHSMVRKIAGLLNARRTEKGLPAEYLYS